MKRGSHTTLAALTLGAALALGMQGGSCGGDTRTAANTKANANTPTKHGGEGQRDENASKEKVDVNRGGTGERIEAGTWGGPGVRLEVREGGAEVEFDCAHGRIEGALAADSSGRFSAAGTYARERGGPVRADEQPRAVPARYSGRVEGETMRLSVEVEGADETLTFTLRHGSAGRLHKCL